MTGAQGVELGNMINNGAMQWYSLVTGKQPSRSLMEQTFGSDFGRNPLVGQAAAPWGVLVGGLVVVVAIVLIAKR